MLNQSQEVVWEVESREWGGINVYQYTPNPVEWVDPWGLAYAKIVTAVVAGVARKLYFNKKGQFAKKPGPKPQKADEHGMILVRKVDKHSL
ncbi:hypothetical protein AAEX37_00576 [Oligella sp. MSHR50489EDL]